MRVGVGERCLHAGGRRRRLLFILALAVERPVGRPERAPGSWPVQLLSDMTIVTVDFTFFAVRPDAPIPC